MPPKVVQLSTKERAQFAKLIQEYETRQYKSAIKTADSLLKTQPMHGETLSLKGLVLASMHQREEGLQLAKQGLRQNLMSFICWHALGIVHRMDRNYEESLKCYGQALRIESGNINLVRESAYMQLQLRNYAPLIDARLILLRAQPQLRVNWVALAIAHDLADNKIDAVRVLSAYEDATHDVPSHNYEFSEVVLYHASMLDQLDKPQSVLDLFASQQDRLFDLPGITQLKVNALEKLGNINQAIDQLRKAIRQNPENTSTIRRLISLSSKDQQDTHREQSVLKLLSDLQAEYPRSTALRRIALEFAQSAELFAEHAKSYLEVALKKGIPSLFSDVKSLYVDQAKRHTIETVVENFRKECDPSQSEANAAPPSWYVWAMYFLAHHYSYIGQEQRALAYIDSIIAHTPTMPELHMTRARILKRAGAYQAASDAMEDARLLDGQDRYLNTKAAKYLLRADKVDDTIPVLKKFTKPDVPDPVADLAEMQAVGYLVEDAEAQVRIGDDALALKRYDQIDKIFAEIYDDQLDFHSYCLRKMTLRAYVSTVHFEDNLYARPTYIRAAYGAVQLYAKLYDLQQSSDDHKAAKQQQRAELFASKQALRDKLKNDAPTKAQEDPNQDDAPPKVDQDPYGERLLGSTTLLQDASRFVSRLQDSAPHRIETWLAACEIGQRQELWLLVLRALVHALRIDPSDPRVHEHLIRFRQGVDAKYFEKDAAQAYKQAVEEFPLLGAPVQTVHAEYVQRYGQQSGDHFVGAANGLWIIDQTNNAQDAANLLWTLLKSPERPSISSLENAYALLQSIQAHAQTKLPSDIQPDAFAEQARKFWPLAERFQTHQVVTQNAASRASEREKWLPTSCA
ncbi:hypothetical protein MPSI1_002356 [Malassezia psittaci]|uniref:Uncharacterized protein n=1 Tax=Malassezia psittaci TaxID=1821823 RepID=A0AAF0JE61_9BASI|nr:hypothetical protein MPSI1_002356 [Malassezia psittaci]